MEPDFSYGALGEKEIKRPNPPYDILVHSIRKRPGDPDGISAKAAIDGLIKAGILADDSPRFVKSIKFTQEKGAKEETVIHLL